jgi:phenylacetate-CoA ligase
LAAGAGALRIAPQQIVVYGEPLLREHRHTIEQVWAVPVHNWWGTSEANVLGVSCGEGPGIHLHDDLYIVEPVHRDGRPARAGERSAGVLLTNLRNHALPLIRYEIDDEVTLLDGACPCGGSYRRIDDVQGRADEVFRYTDATFVHPHVFRSRLAAEPGVVEYQVLQTTHGADVLVRCTAPADLDRLRDRLAQDLRRCGLSRPRLSVRPVDQLDRGGTGKLRRFIPLRASG